MPSGRHRVWLEPVLGVLAAVVLIHVWTVIRDRWSVDELSDFQLIYESARLWRAGASPYAVDNLNPPLFVWATSPLAWLSRRTAWIVWQSLNLAAFVWSIRLTLHATRGRLTPLLVAVLVLHGSTAVQLIFGQVAWLLGLPLTLAWVAYRKGHLRTCGLWLGIVLAVKPFLLTAVAVGLVSRRWRIVLGWALGLAFLLSLLMAMVHGVDAYRAYWAIGQETWWRTTMPTIASLTGFLHRTGLSPAWSLVLASAVWIPVLRAWPRLDADRRWLATISAVLLVNPLGWVYYLAWLLPFVLAVWKQPAGRGLLACGMVASSLPPAVATVDVWTQPLYLIGLLLLWAAAVTPLDRALVAEPDRVHKARAGGLGRGQ